MNNQKKHKPLLVIYLARAFIIEFFQIIATLAHKYLIYKSLCDIFIT